MTPGGPPRARALRVLVGDTRGRTVVVRGLANWLRSVAPASVRGTVSIAFVSNRRIRGLNCRYRGHDSATDVLSFPANSEPAEAPKARRRLASTPHSPLPTPYPALPTPFLGEVVIARGDARRQAGDAGHSYLTELKTLALHGLLHLIGYDHERDNGQMRRVERRLRRQGGLPEGLIERAGSCT